MLTILYLKFINLYEKSHIKKFESVISVRHEYHYIIFVRQYIVKHSGFLIALTLKPLIYDLIQILFLQSAK